jgi:hypothetical protein
MCRPQNCTAPGAPWFACSVATALGLDVNVDGSWY